MSEPAAKRGCGRATCTLASVSPFFPLSRPPAIVVTGGPGAGKTALLEVARRELGKGGAVEIVPEAASIVFGGGFPRFADDPSRRAAQRAIYHVQSELERRLADVRALQSVENAEPAPRVMLCDRGTIDALAYWPGTADEFFDDVGSILEREFSRYQAVLHLRVPPIGNGYLNTSLRIESAREALRIDERLLEVWSRHPCRIVIDSDVDFLHKTRRALDALRELVPCAIGEGAEGAVGPSRSADLPTRH